MDGTVCNSAKLFGENSVIPLSSAVESGKEGGLMRLKPITWMLLLGMVLCAAGAVRADTAATQPSPAVTANELQLRANQDMARGDYAGALPLLEKASQLLSDQPDVLGPVLEQIRVCRRQIKANATATATVAPLGPTITPQSTAPVAPPAPVYSVPLAVDGGPRKIHDAPQPGETVEYPIKELGNFDYDADKGGDIPDDVKRLDGCHFQTSGYMVPLDQAEAITQFALVPSLFACCYGQPPQIQHTIVVQVPKGKAVSYFPDQITVEGTLHVSEQKDGGFIVSIFQMDATSVRGFEK
jgi:hypothetical protein